MNTKIIDGHGKDIAFNMKILKENHDDSPELWYSDY